MYCLIGFFAISIIGSILHFVYDWLNHNKIISLFVAVNESTWEHLKLAVIPTFIWFFIGLFLKINNLVFGTLICLMVICLVIPIIFYSYTHFTKKPILAIDISSFFIAIGLAMIITNTIFKIANLPIVFHIIGIIGICLIGLAFVIFTYFPPKIFLFKDPISNKYGIEGHYDDKKYGNSYKQK